MKPADTCNAFVPGEMITVKPHKGGKLSSLTFAVKEVYDVKGFVTDAGNPHWKNTHPAAIIIRAASEQDALRIANETRFGLGSSIWSKDTARAEQLAAYINAGCTFINGMVNKRGNPPALPGD